MKTKATAADADISKAWHAMERAAARARQLAEQTGTPLYVLKDGRVVDLNRQLLARLQKEKKVKSLGAGRGAKWQKLGN
jgi:diaminopimelate decarboxylase